MVPSEELSAVIWFPQWMDFFGDDLHEGAFAGSVGADDRHVGSCFYGKRYVVEYVCSVPADGGVLDCYDGFHVLCLCFAGSIAWVAGFRH